MNGSIVRVLGLLIAAALLPVFGTSSYFHHILVLWLLYSIMALSANVIIGYLGELTFGHAAFVGVGAYACALSVLKLGLPPWLGLIAGVFVAGMFGGIVGALALRSEGPQFAILTLGFGAILQAIASYWFELTRGPMGISNVPAFSLPAIGIDFSQSAAMYYLLLAILACVVYLMRCVEESRLGAAFLAVRENAQLAASVGIDVFRIKLIGFVLATAMAGLAGGLYAQYIRVVTPEIMGLQYVAALIMIVMIGGRGTIGGPILGAAIYVALLELLRVTGSLRFVVFSILLLICVRYLPDGLLGSMNRLFKRARAENAEAS